MKAKGMKEPSSQREMKVGPDKNTKHLLWLRVVSPSGVFFYFAPLHFILGW